MIIDLGRGDLDLPDALFHYVLEVLDIDQQHLRLKLFEPLQKSRPIAAVVLFDDR